MTINILSHVSFVSTPLEGIAAPGAALSMAPSEPDADRFVPPVSPPEFFGRSSRSLAGPRFLLVDDEELIVRSLARLIQGALKLRDEDVLTATGLESACRVFDLHAPAITAVLSDMNMPYRGDGLRLYDHVRRARRDLPFAVLSGGMDAEVHQALADILQRDPKTNHFLKPSTGAEILNWLRACL